MDQEPRRVHSPSLSGRTKLFIVIVAGLVVLTFLYQIRSILTPFLWALLAAYLLGPIVNYFNVRGGMPRLWSVILLYAGVALILITASRYLYPKAVEQGTVFVEDIPRLEAALVGLVGPKPMGIDVAHVVDALLQRVTGSTGNANNAGHLLVNAAETIFKVFLFLVSTFYLLMDGPRMKRSIAERIPEAYRPELLALARQINLTWQEYIRGELFLFVVMATATSIGLTILQVPGAIFLGIASGALELLPLVGPYFAGTLAVSVAYFSGSNPWSLSQIAYAGIVAAMYFVFRQAEDYLVMPHVLGRAVRLRPLVVLFALTAGGIFGGLLGLVVAVPIAASIRAIGSYLYAKLADEPVVFEPVHTFAGGIIEIPVHEHHDYTPEDSIAGGPGSP